jgi:hypothetical protein
MSHHCFWINKCIARRNRGLYIAFIVFALIYANHSLFICLELLWDDVNLPYDSKKLHVYIFDKHKGFRVLGAAVAGVFSIIVGLPLWFLMLIEFFKECGLLGKKKNTVESQLQEIILNTNEKKPEKLVNSTMVELQEGKNEFLIDEEDDNEKDPLINVDDHINNNNSGAINDDIQVKESINSIKLEDKKENDEEDNKIQLIENVEPEVKEEEKEEEKNQNQEEEKEEEKQEVIVEQQQEEGNEEHQPEEEGNEEQKQEEGNNEEHQQEENAEQQEEGIEEKQEEVVVEQQEEGNVEKEQAEQNNEGQ